MDVILFAIDSSNGLSQEMIINFWEAHGYSDLSFDLKELNLVKWQGYDEKNPSDVDDAKELNSNGVLDRFLETTKPQTVFFLKFPHGIDMHLADSEWELLTVIKKWAREYMQETAWHMVWGDAWTTIEECRYYTGGIEVVDKYFDLHQLSEQYYYSFEINGFNPHDLNEYDHYRPLVFRIEK